MGEIWNPHNGDPLNEGERLVIDHLRNELPDDCLIIPDVQIRYDTTRRVDEIDALVITPFGLVVVEIKDYSGRVIFGVREHRVDNSDRKDPVDENNYRAMRIKGKLVDSDERLRSVWVADQVVLARDPKFLDIAKEVKSKIVMLNEAAERLSDPKSMLWKDHRVVPFETEWVLKALDFSLRSRTRTESFGQYVTTGLKETDPNGNKLYEGKHSLSGEMYEVRVHPVDRFLEEEEKEKLIEKALRSYRVLTKLKAQRAETEQMLLPEDAFLTDVGQIVTVTPLSDGVPLLDYATDRHNFIALNLEDDSLERVCLTILRDVAKAVSVAHSAGIAHRKLSPLSVLVHINENEVPGEWIDGNWIGGGYSSAKVSGWDRADLFEQSTNSSVFDEGNRFSDEFAAPEIGTPEFYATQQRWRYADLWSLGKIIEWIWGKNGITEGGLPLPERLEKLVKGLTDTDPLAREDVGAYQVFITASEELKDKIPPKISEADEIVNAVYNAPSSFYQNLVPDPKDPGPETAVLDQEKIPAYDDVIESAPEYESDYLPPSFSLEKRKDGSGDDGSEEYEPGDLINGRWKVIERLGSGVSSTVYHVEDTRLTMMTQGYALKVFKGAIKRDLVEVEFVALMTMRNPHIMRVFSLEEVGETFGLLTELIKGKNLLVALEDGSLPPTSKLIPLFRELLLALQALHESMSTDDLPVVHRDIKPSNVLYNELTGLVLIDFGGAAVKELMTEQVTFTRAYRHGDFGKFSKDPEIDLFAFAVTFHELLTGGKHPFPVAANYDEICLGDPNIDSELDDSFKGFFLDSLSDDPSQRYKSARDMLKGFDNAVENVGRGLEGVRESHIVDQKRSEDLNASLKEFADNLDEAFSEISKLPTNAKRSKSIRDAPPSPPGEIGIDYGDLEKITGRSNTVQLGPKVTLEVLQGVDHRVETFSPSGEPDVNVSVTSARICSSNENVDGIRLDVEVFETDYGEVWIKAVYAHDSPPRIQRLVHGLRPGIHPIPGEAVPSGRLYIELRQAQISDDPDWPRVKKVPLADLNSAAGDIDIVRILEEWGALSVMTRQETWGDPSNRRTDLCVCFEGNNILVPLASYALTRVAPLVDDIAPLLDDMVELPPALTRVAPLVDDMVELPPLDTRLSTGTGGMGSNWLDDHCYWAIHPSSEENPTGWREINFPFKSLETALFGGNGAEALIKQRGRMAQRTRRWGKPQLVVVRVGPVAVLTDGFFIAPVDWEKVAFEDTSATMNLFANCEKFELKKSTWV